MTVRLHPRTDRATPTASHPGLGRRQVHAVAACYFIASFAALGLPPYLTAILPEFGDRQARWAGLLYVVPTLFAALGAPLWGHLADRFGRKRLLLRAQLGLTVSFLLAGVANSLPAFAAALILQGILGGTFAASNGYLAAALDGPGLSWALTLMQGSARAALVAAPIVVGALSPWLSPHRQYALLAVLPLTAAGLLALLPEPRKADLKDSQADDQPTPHPSVPIVPTSAVLTLYALEFAFVFSTVISYPYLIALLQRRLPGVSGAVAGALFALPHLCYLLLAAPTHRALRPRPRTGIILGFALVAAGLAGNAVAGSLPAFAAARLVLGAGMTLGLVALSLLAAEAACGRPPGRTFGSLEFVSKGGAVVAGVVAAIGAEATGPTAPVFAGAAVALATVLAALLIPALAPVVFRISGSR
ncbi:MAG: MFS transporter [Streptomycetaceae bacterium]|nr:MFS transporter [Streptomycetaceae bacterium]